jgi:23S rRNA pseudouridine1911/1915/1917 synthase
MKQVRAETGIVHLKVQFPARLTDFLSNSDLSPLPILPERKLIEEWLHYGCVYVDGLRTRQDVELSEGQILRLHTRRKNYVSGRLNLKSRIVLEEEEFLVIDKPAGVPTHATLDNYIENAQFQLSEELGRPILVTHRLDIATQGLLIFAKNAGAQAALNKAFAKGRVEKIYYALTKTPVNEGLHTHYMDPESRVPKRVSAEEIPGGWLCQLIVQETFAHAMGFSSKIRLLTGKTHQIRAQFAALGAPVIGDAAYGSKHGYSTPLGIALECNSLKFPFRSREYSVERRHSLLEEKW